MIDVLRSWLLGVTGVSILSALAGELMPAGSVKQVGRLVCGLVLLCALLRPVMTLETLPLERLSHGLQGGMDTRTQELEQQQQEQLKMVIEGQCAAYIVDKAEELGLFCTAQVRCSWDSAGIWLPQSARISGVFSPQERARLEDILLQDLGISQDGIQFTEEEQA